MGKKSRERHVQRRYLIGTLCTLVIDLYKYYHESCRRILAVMMPLTLTLFFCFPPSWRGYGKMNRLAGETMTASAKRSVETSDLSSTHHQPTSTVVLFLLPPLSFSSSPKPPESSYRVIPSPRVSPPFSHWRYLELKKAT